MASGPTAVDGKSSFRKSSITTDWEKNGQAFENRVLLPFGKKMEGKEIKQRKKATMVSMVNI